MLRFPVCLVGLVLTVAVSASAQPPAEPVGEEKQADVCQLVVNEEKLANPPPPRDVEYKQVNEKLKLSLKAADPKWIEQKYVAILRLQLPEGIHEARRPVFYALDRNDPLYKLQLAGPRNFLVPERYVPEARERTQGDFFRDLVLFTPDDRKPDKEEIEFFSSDDSNKLISEIALPQRQAEYREYRIPAPSTEAAERRARAFLMLLDQGFSRPLQLKWFSMIEKRCKELEQTKSELEAAQRDSENIRNELTQYDDFQVEMLPELNLQRLQLEVEITGVKARLDTCDKLLAERGLSDERRKRVEDVKIAAAIELSGVEARRTKLSDFVSKVKAKKELQQKSEGARTIVGSRYQKIKSLESTIETLKTELKWLAPLPVMENQVLIQPIEWIP